MIAYPYEGRDLFAEPETYFYADCRDEDFLAAWRDSRSKAAARARARARQADDINESRASADGPGEALVDILDLCLAELRSGKIDAASAAPAIAPFLLKYEVFKRLFARYDADRRRIAEAGLAPLRAYVGFGECLAEIAEAGGSLKHLSTLLKLCDALAGLAAEAFSSSEANRLVDLLARERALVDRVTAA